MTKINRRAALAGLAITSALMPQMAWAQGADAPVSVPIEIFRQKIMFAVSVNGRELRAVYDSGAARSLMARSVADELGLDLGGRGRASGFGGSAELQLASNIDVAVGGLTHRYTQLVVVDLSSFTAPFGREIEFIVGVDVFPQHVVDVDVAARRLGFVERARFSPPADALELALDNSANNFTIPISINGRTVRANFDLGSGSALDIGPDLARELGFRRDDLPTGQANGIGGVLEVGLASVPSVGLAGQTFADVPIQVTRTPLPTGRANLGFPILSRFRVYIDYRRERAWLYPRAGSEAPAFERDLAGLRMSRSQHDRLDIVHVGRGGPAAAAGLTLEDQIVAIDGARVADWPAGTDFRAWSHGVDPRETRLTLADGREIALALQRFY